MKKSSIGLDELKNPVLGIGTTRDKNYYSYYSAPRLLEREDLNNMYRTSWLVKRVIDTVADDMTRAWRRFTVKDDQAKENENIEKILHAEEEKLGLRRITNEAVRWGRLYGGALVYLGMRQADPRTPLSVEEVQQGDLEYLYVLDRWRVDTQDQPLYCGPHSLFFGLPEYYHLSEPDILVHASRLLRFGGEALPHDLRKEQDMWDDNVLEHVFGSIMRYDTAASTLSTMMTEANIDVIQIQNLGDMLLSQASEEMVAVRLEELARRKSVNRMLVLDAAEKYEKKSTNFQSIDNIMNIFMHDVCGAADIPFTRLFGQSAKGMNATGDNDIRQYYDMVAAKQERHMRPVLSYFDEIFVRSTLGYMPQEVSFTFNPLWQLSHLEKAQVERLEK